MAILAALVAFGSRFASKVLTTALGWASTLLFGRVPASRQILLLGITFGSVIWMVLVAGIVFPDIGAFLLVLVPKQDYVPEWVIRLVMLIGALVVPGVIGGLTLALSGSADRHARQVLESIARGYPLTVLLAVLLVFLAGLAIWRKAHSLARRWTDAHVPLVVKPGAYDEVAADLDKAISDAGLDVEPRAAPAVMSKPARWLAAVGGTSSSSLVPERMIQLARPRARHPHLPDGPHDLGQARARRSSPRGDGEPADDLGGAPDRERRGAGHRGPAGGARQRVGRGRRPTPLRRGRRRGLHRDRRDPRDARSSRTRSGRCCIASACRSNATCAWARWRARPCWVRATPGTSGPIATLTAVGRMLRGGAEAVLDIAADERTAEAAGRVGGPQVRIGLRAAATALTAVRTAARRRGSADDAAEAPGDGEVPAATDDEDGPRAPVGKGPDQGRSTAP